VSTLLIGQTLGQYRVVEQLGAGGMGVVYKAQDVRLGRLVALKVLPQTNADEQEEAVERFRREARTASSLNHPNICTIYSFDDHQGQLYLAMELLEGETLDRKLSGRSLDVRLILELGSQIADALDAAHSEGILHRDIKPANIFLTRRGQVKVLDFGLAKLAPGFNRMRGDSAPQLTEQFTSMVGTTVGTVAYMSRTWTLVPICSRSAWCCTRWRPDDRASAGRRRPSSSMAFSIATQCQRARSTPPSRWSSIGSSRRRWRRIATCGINRPPTCGPTYSGCVAIRARGA
jgi:serine/threonine protein kinase